LVVVGDVGRLLTLTDRARPSLYCWRLQGRCTCYSDGKVERAHGDNNAFDACACLQSLLSLQPVLKLVVDVL